VGKYKAFTAPVDAQSFYLVKTSLAGLKGGRFSLFFSNPVHK